MKLFTLDPSLTTVGWCFAEAKGKTITVLNVGRIIPPKDGTVVERSQIVADKVKEVIFDKAVRPAKSDHALEIVIEIPSGRTTTRHAGGGYGLAKYGFLVGNLFQALAVLFGDQVHGEDENWTGSRSKKARQKIAFEHYAPLKRIKDPGMDISDAVALAVWWTQIGRKKRKGADA